MNTKDYPVDYTIWRLLAWCGPFFMTLFFVLWGLLCQNFPPRGADWDAAMIYKHYIDNGMALKIGMSVCIVAGAFYMPWGLSVSRVMQRIEGPDGMLAKLEMMGATITCCPLIVACGIWLTGAMEAPEQSPQIIHMLYWMGWLIIDLAYMVTSFQIFAVSVCILRDKREKPLYPAWLSWWGYITVLSFFPVSLIPFFKTGPFAFHGLFNFWVAFPTWYIWVFGLSICTLRAITKIQIEDGAMAKVREPSQVGALPAH